MEDDFYATLKLKSGEEIFCKVAASEENGRTVLLVSNPIIVSELTGRSGVFGYKMEPWLKTTTEDLFVLDMDNVMTLSESSDVEMIMMYQSFVRKQENIGSNKTLPSKSMGSLGNVNDMKEILEKIYKGS
tara:strand:+ start:3801 stop:4190 length:390 start_codon:yes stop_codon:yes gene_type:complete